VVKHWNGKRLTVISRTRARSVPNSSVPELH
jgi:hypothetical protein